MSTEDHLLYALSTTMRNLNIRRSAKSRLPSSSTAIGNIMNQPTYNPSKLGFLCLPPEIRNQIYEYIAWAKYHPYQYSSDPQPIHNEVIYIANSLWAPQGLFLTCKQIRHEATSIYYSKRGFAITASPYTIGCERIFRRWLRLIGDDGARYLRKLRFDGLVKVEKGNMGIVQLYVEVLLTAPGFRIWVEKASYPSMLPCREGGEEGSKKAAKSVKLVKDMENIVARLVLKKGVGQFGVQEIDRIFEAFHRAVAASHRSYERQ